LCQDNPQCVKMVHPCMSGFRKKFPPAVRKFFWALYRKWRAKYSITDPNLEENLFNEVDIIDTNEKLYSRHNTRWKGLPRLIRKVLQRLHEISNKEEKLNRRPQSKISTSKVEGDNKPVKLDEHYSGINYVNIPFNKTHNLVVKLVEVGMNSI
jgi:hypothetical protein